MRVIGVVIVSLRHRVWRLNRWIQGVGVGATVRWTLLGVSRSLGWYRKPTWRVRPQQVQHPLKARLNRSSDMSVFVQVFVFEEYKPLNNLRDVSLVLDLGANVGYSTAYFLSSFPCARVVAVEPDDRNAAICRENLEPYGDRALLVHGAVWPERTQLCLSTGTFGDGLEWATQVKPPEGGATGTVQAWDVGSLIDMAGMSSVDLLKVDIEAAELDVFGRNTESWLPRVRNICIELHGDQCREVFFQALAGYDYELEQSEDLVICRNLRPKPAAA